MENSISMKNIGFTFSGNDASNYRIAESIYVVYGLDVPDEPLTEFLEGVQQYWADSHAGDSIFTNYILQGNAFVPCPDSKEFDKFKGDKLSFTPAYALSFTSHEVGALGQKEGDIHGKALKPIVKDIRKKVQDYKANVKSRLMAYLRQIDAETNGKSRTRTSVTFGEWVEKTLMQEMEKRAKSNLSRGNITKDDYARLRKAVVEFMTVWKHAE